MYEVGQKIGRLKILDLITFKHPVIGNKRIYKVRCDCGVERFVDAKLPRADNNSDNEFARNTSCGCLKFDIRRKDLKGKRFGKLVVGKFDRVKKHFECKCDCGNLCYVDSWELTRDGVDACENCRAVK